MAAGGDRVFAWRPTVPGVAEVFHARFVDHVYPLHTHDAWTLLIIDDGEVRYHLDRHQQRAVQPLVTLLPPHVPHDGRAATHHGFRKRVVYLDTTVLPADLAGAAVDDPNLQRPLLRRQIHRLHAALAAPGDEFEAESRLAVIREELRRHLRRRRPARSAPPDGDLAARLRELLDARTTAGVTLREAAALLHAHPTHLVRAFSRRYGLPPHAYLTGRRVELARRMLLAGARPAQVAAAAGFYDQAHLTRHFKRYLAVTPARYASFSTGSPATVAVAGSRWR